MMQFGGSTGRALVDTCDTATKYNQVTNAAPARRTARIRAAATTSSRGRRRSRVGELHDPED